MSRISICTKVLSKYDRSFSTWMAPYMFYMNRGVHVCLKPDFDIQKGYYKIQVPYTNARGFAKSKKDKKEKNGGRKDSNNDDEFDDSVVLELAKSAKTSMEESFKRFNNEFAKIRVGTASADMYGDVHIDGYGQLSAAGQITVLSATSISISPYDPTMAGAIADAIREYTANSINPRVEADTVKITVPKPTKETRDNLVKMASKISERCKTDMRQFRKSALDILKKAKASGMEEDAIKKITKEIEVITEKKLDEVTAAMKAKEKSLQS